ncbi:MAG: hypothetical protein MI861_29025 [Pirellulales bacterium]|nr:hypothetical protein [Pirellulales bacterium]
MLRAKGRKPLLLQVMLVVLWIVGEFTGAVVAAAIHIMQNGPNAPMGLGIYLFAIVGAAMGAAFTFLVAALLPAQNVAPQPAPMVEDPFDRRLHDPDNPYAP